MKTDKRQKMLLETIAKLWIQTGLDLHYDLIIQKKSKEIFKLKKSDNEKSTL